MHAFFGVNPNPNPNDACDLLLCVKEYNYGELEE